MSGVRVQCPGPGDRGCAQMLRLEQSYCPNCGRIFTGSELFDYLVERVGWMEAELRELAES